MICFHGTPINPERAAYPALRGRHAMVSFANAEQAALAFEVCASVALDNGAFSLWQSGAAVDEEAYLRWLEQWRHHPAFAWCIIPDIIDGDESANRAACERWPLDRAISVPVWHLHESLDYLKWLVAGWPRVALGSSGEYATPGTDAWWVRMGEAMRAATDASGRPLVKFHGLRMMDPTLFSHLPLSSVDSCNIARNVGIDSRWDGHMYLRGLSKATRAVVLRDRIEGHASASVWNGHEAERSWGLLG